MLPEAGAPPPTLDPATAPWLIMGLASRGSEATAQGRFDDAEALLNTLTAFARGYVLIDVWRACTQAYLYACTDRPALGTAVLRYAHDRARDEGVLDHPWMALLDATLARYAVFAGDTAGASAAVRNGARKLETIRHGQPGTRLYSCVSLAMASALLGRPEEAAGFLAKAREVIPLTTDMEHLQREYWALVEREAAAAESAPVTLTPTEARVLRALSSHASIPEIASSMVLSPATVRAHVRALYRKLGVHDRAEAVAAARSRSLIS